MIINGLTEVPNSGMNTNGRSAIQSPQEENTIRNQQLLVDGMAVRLRYELFCYRTIPPLSCIYILK